MTIHDKPGWMVFYQEGKQYLDIVKGAHQKEQKFTPEIIYNLACMSIEKLFMSYFIKIGKMPYDHTLIDLVESMNEYKKIPTELEEKLLHMNNFQEICSIEHYERSIPTHKDIETFITALEQTKAFIQNLVKV